MSKTSHTWGSTPEERALQYPCDELLPDTQDVYFRAISIAAPRATVFRWLCQLRVAPYSYDWIDNFGRRSPRALTPGVEELAVGQPFMRDFGLVSWQPDQHITLKLIPGKLIGKVCGDFAATYLLRDGEDGNTRLIMKTRAAFLRSLRWMLRPIMPWLDMLMMRRQLLNFKELSERDVTERRPATFS